MRTGVCYLLNIKQTKATIFFLLLSLFPEERKTTFTECFSLLFARSYYIVSSCINLQDLMAEFPFSIGHSSCPFQQFLIYFHFTFFFLHYTAHLLLHIWKKELFLTLLSENRQKAVGHQKLGRLTGGATSIWNMVIIQSDQVEGCFASPEGRKEARKQFGGSSKFLGRQGAPILMFHNSLWLLHSQKAFLISATTKWRGRGKIQSLRYLKLSIIVQTFLLPSESAVHPFCHAGLTIMQKLPGSSALGDWEQFSYISTLFSPL